jgi:hypothetical protein
MKQALEAMDNLDIKKAVSIILEYYDQTYAFGLSQRDKARVTEWNASEGTDEETVDALIRLADSGF